MSFRLYVDPFDTFLIRDGRPFNQDDAGRTRAASRFPPPPDTLYGAVRVALARSHGWSGSGDWSTVADFPDGMIGKWSEPGTLQIAGPFFEHNGDPLLPVPAHVFARLDKSTHEVKEITPLKPAGKADLQSDLGDIRLLEMPPHADNLTDVPLAGRYAPADQVLSLLDGAAPSDRMLGRPVSAPGRTRSILVNAPSPLPGWGVDDLVATEIRVGIERNAKTRQVEESRLYASAPQSLKAGVRLFVDVENAAIGQAGLPAAVPFGGEGRFIHATRQEASAYVTCSRPPASRYLLYLATPLLLRRNNAMQVLGFRCRIPGLPDTHKIISAAIPAIETQAGFVAERAGRPRRQTANRQVVPAGSVLFVDGDPSELPPVLSDGVDAEGVDTGGAHMGYGRFLIGRWNDD